MKQKLALFLAICLLAILCVTPVFAVSPANNQSFPKDNSIVQLEDGSYLVTSIATINDKLRTTDVTGRKTVAYYNDNKELQCALTVYATFRCDGSTAKYLSSYHDFTAYDNAWSLSNGRTYGTSGGFTGSGTAAGTFVKKFLGIVTKSINTDTTVYCDANGNVW